MGKRGRGREERYRERVGEGEGRGRGRKGGREGGDIMTKVVHKVIEIGGDDRYQYNLRKVDINELPMFTYRYTTVADVDNWYQKQINDTNDHGSCASPVTLVTRDTMVILWAIMYWFARWVCMFIYIYMYICIYIYISSMHGYLSREWEAVFCFLYCHLCMNIYICTYDVCIIYGPFFLSNRMVYWAKKLSDRKPFCLMYVCYVLDVCCVRCMYVSVMFWMYVTGVCMYLYIMCLVYVCTRMLCVWCIYVCICYVLNVCTYAFSF